MRNQSKPMGAKRTKFVIPNDHVNNVCKLGQGELTCAYLLGTMHGMECAKLPTNEVIRKTIESRLAAGSMGAKGDNCDGWPQ